LRTKHAAFIGGQKDRLRLVAGSSQRRGPRRHALTIEKPVFSLVSEGLKPLIARRGHCGAGHFYCSQSTRAGLSLGGDIDGYKLLSPTRQPACGRGTSANGGMAIFPVVRRAPCCAVWAASWTWFHGRRLGPSSTNPHRRPLLTAAGAMAVQGHRPASAMCFAHLLARDAPHPKATVLPLYRFEKGLMIDEKRHGQHP